MPTYAARDIRGHRRHDVRPTQRAELELGLLEGPASQGDLDIGLPDHPTGQGPHAAERVAVAGCLSDDAHRAVRSLDHDDRAGAQASLGSNDSLGSDDKDESFSRIINEWRVHFPEDADG